MATDLPQTQGQMFGPAGANHAPGLVPDPGSSANSPPFVLGDDGAFHQVTPTNSYTPAVTGSGGTITVVSSTGFYAITGRLVNVYFNIEMSASSTATLPNVSIPIATNGSISGNPIIGMCRESSTTGNVYPILVLGGTSCRIAFNGSTAIFINSATNYTFQGSMVYVST